MRSFDAVIIGAGAAGLMCALSAAGRGARVLLLDHGDRAGAKILISGGGRCNFTNREVTAERFHSGNPHFCKSALSRYSQHDFISLVERHRIAYHEKTLGQLFCDGSAEQIVRMLLDECQAAGVEIGLSTRVSQISKSDRFSIQTDQGEIAADQLVLATGGLSIPKLGASDFAYRTASQFGLSLTPVWPGLVGLKADDQVRDFTAALSGVAVDCIASIGKVRFREALLFTHRGFSGPAILQISSLWRPGQAVVLNLLPDLDAAAYLLERKQSRPKAEVKTVLSEVLPNRLAAGLCETRIANGILAEQSDKALRAAGEVLNRFAFTPTGTDGYGKAEVTVGGIDTAGLSSKTMEAKAVPGLFVIGEAVDVTGWLGGYNFQWAWSSGWVAGQAIGERR